MLEVESFKEPDPDYLKILVFLSVVVQWILWGKGMEVLISILRILKFQMWNNNWLVTLRMRSPFSRFRTQTFPMTSVQCLNHAVQVCQKMWVKCDKMKFEANCLIICSRSVTMKCLSIHIVTTELLSEHIVTMECLSLHIVTRKLLSVHIVTTKCLSVYIVTTKCVSVHCDYISTV